VVVVTTKHHPYLYALMVPLFLMISSTGVAKPNAAALALDRHPNTARSAAAVLGVIQFALVEDLRYPDGVSSLDVDTERALHYGWQR
jgi:hypothetical protein